MKTALSLITEGLDFHTNKKILEEVAIIPSKRLHNKIDGFSTHLMKRSQKKTSPCISLKLQKSLGLAKIMDAYLSIPICRIFYIFLDMPLCTHICGHLLKLQQTDFWPKWTQTDSEVEVMVIGTFLLSPREVTSYSWSCMFGEVEVPAEILVDGVLCCLAPPHEIGQVPFYITPFL